MRGKGGPKEGPWTSTIGNRAPPTSVQRACSFGTGRKGDYTDADDDGGGGEEVVVTGFDG